MIIEGQDHFFTIYFPGFVCFVLFYAKISGERLKDHWSSGSLLCYCRYFDENFYSNAFCLYPRHLCRRVYSFRLSVRQLVFSFKLPSVAWNLRQSFALKFLKGFISQQLLIRKHSYLDHSYPGGLALTP